MKMCLLSERENIDEGVENRIMRRICGAKGRGIIR
jgi:hypothetical protein